MLAQDPNDTSFWAADYSSGNFTKFNITTGAIELTPFPNPGHSILGMCIKGEHMTARPTPTPTVVCSTTTNWCTSISPNTGTGSNLLNGAVALSDGKVWAVGGRDVVNQSGQSLIDSFDGTTWSTVSSVPTVGILNGISTVTANDVWAVGDNEIIHWDNTSWSQVSSPSGAKAVAARISSDVWAVGSSNIEHWDGTSWAVSTPVPTNGALKGVAVITTYSTSTATPTPAPTIDVWAVGSSNNGTSPLIMHEDSVHATWTVVPAATNTPVGATSSYLNSIDYFTQNNVWAVGAYYASGYYHTLTEYWDGSTWRVVRVKSKLGL